MLTLFFIIMMVAFMGEAIGLGFKMAWGVTKFVFAIILFPIFLVGMLIIGLVHIALPILIIAGIVMLVRSFLERSTS